MAPGVTPSPRWLRNGNVSDSPPRNAQAMLNFQHPRVRLAQGCHGRPARGGASSPLLWRPTAPRFPSLAPTTARMHPHPQSAPTKTCLFPSCSPACPNESEAWKHVMHAPNCPFLARSNPPLPRSCTNPSSNQETPQIWRPRVLAGCPEGIPNLPWSTAKCTPPPPANGPHAARYRAHRRVRGYRGGALYQEATKNEGAEI